MFAIAVCGLGFCLNPDGDVLAVAGDETFTMAFAPPEATRFVWSHRSKEKTQFGKEMDKLADAGATAAKMALVAGLYVGAIALEAQCDDGVHGHHGERHHRHKEGRHDGRDPKSPENQKDK